MRLNLYIIFFEKSYRKENLAVSFLILLRGDVILPLQSSVEALTIVVGPMEWRSSGDGKYATLIYN